MTVKVLRSAACLVACLAATLLASCGGGTIASALVPTRIIAFGDGWTDVGQGGSRYTVNDGSVNIWSQQVALSYGLTLTSGATGGQGFARGNTRVLAKPDAAGNAATPSLKEQIDTYLTAGTFGTSDIVLVGSGTGDLITEMASFTAGTITRDQVLANARQAGRDLATQVRRLVSAGAKYVVVSGTYNLGKSPWAIAIGQTTLLSDASGAFNDQFLIGAVDLGANVLYVDAALHYNLVVASPSSYSLTNVNTAVCTSVDAGNGIGTGRGKINSALCNTGTITSGVDYSKYLFADQVYPTPRGHQLFGDYAVARVKARW